MKVNNFGYLHHIRPVSKVDGIDKKRDKGANREGPEEKLASELYLKWKRNLEEKRG